MNERTPPTEQKISALHGWLIRKGLAAPPAGDDRHHKKALEQERQAKWALIWHMLRPPQR